MLEKNNGLDLSLKKNAKSLKIDSSLYEGYETTKIFELKKWMKTIPQDREYNAIDFGSGKGSVLIALSKYNNIRRIYGIEISRELSFIANRNIRLNNINNTRVLNINALDTPNKLILNSNLFYFYNPFSYKIFLSIIQKIEESIDRNKRACVIIYFNPKHKIAISSSKYFNSRIICKNILSKANTHIYFEGFPYFK
jgi:hypothetical protein